ncbi:MAG: MerR family transcriptional regulator, partial [Clostridium celatum]|nr:MerR family transcriptional regulator [Clostridium celatum]
TFLEERIRVSLDEGLNKIFVKFYEERSFIKYNNTNRFTEEFEVNLSKILAEVERKYTYFNKELGFVISYKNLKEDNKIKYRNTMIDFTRGMDIEEYDKIILPRGKYLNLNFDDDYNDIRKYYDIIMNYIEDNNIEVLGDFYEIYIITRVSSNGMEKSLGKIQILIK